MINFQQQERIPTTGVLIVPSRITEEEIMAVKAICEGRQVRVFGGTKSVTEEELGEIKSWVESGHIALWKSPPAVGWNGRINDTPSEVLAMLCSLEVPILPLTFDRPAESSLRFVATAGLPTALGAFGKVMPAGQANVAGLWQEWFAGQADTYEERDILDKSLAYAVLQAVKHHGSQFGVHDGNDGTYLTYFELTAAALALSQHLKRETSKTRIGIVLPPGKAGIIANLAVILAGKTPVNLNFTAGKDAVESAIRQADLDRFLTVDLVVRKMQSFPWPPTKQLIMIERVMPLLKGKAKMWGAALKLLPASVLASLLGLSKSGGRQEAALLFTSGSSGEPKGVVLSHRNLLANATQFGVRLGLRDDEAFLGALPFFHSFGFTVAIFYPLLQGVRLVTYPSPLDAPKLAELIEAHKISIMISTPTFLRGFLRKVKPEQLQSLTMVITGAEKLPISVADAFRETFGKPVLEGYGLTETTPVTNFNQPDQIAPDDTMVVSPSARFGTVGQLVPGLAIRLTDANTGEAVPLDAGGIIHFKGPNIFEGYLHQEKKTQEVLTEDGWFRTGDLGRVDADGFLTIEGRLSRFSKIGGEMVPHETVEDHIVKALGLESESERKIVVVGVPDPDKGEALILLSTVAGESLTQELIQLRYALLDRGVPALWIPKKMLRVPEVPILASGKLDLKKCEQIALST